MGPMLRYHIAFYLPPAPGEMAVAEALDFPGAALRSRGDRSEVKRHESLNPLPARMQSLREGRSGYDG